LPRLLTSGTPMAELARRESPGPLPPSDRGDRFYLPQLDGLRFVAFFAVFVHHALGRSRQEPPPWASAIGEAGGFGVDLFFILSSFLITALLLQEQARQGRARVGAFWVRRALRIWPLYFTVVSIAVVVTHPPGWYATSLLTFTLNWALVHRMYDSSLNILWSLAFEEQFYLAWPLLFALLGGRGLPAVAVCLIGGSLVMRASLLASLGSLAVHGVWVYPFGRFEPFALGILLAWGWSRWRRSWPARPACVGIVAVALGWAALTGLIRLATEAGITMAWPPVWAYLVADLILAGILGVVLMAGGGFLAHPVLVYLGRISYGLYVFHLMVIDWLIPRLGGAYWPLRVTLSFGLTLGLAALSYALLERPFLRLKARFTYVRSAPV
jgi:peptidoglycan/LPS O-acetylase OafA/YrhL